MRNIRIYKDDIRTHILRSLFFTDTAIVSVGVLVIAISIYLTFVYGFHFFDWGYYLSAVFVAIIFFIAFVSQKIDNQPIVKVVPRATAFTTSKKEQRVTGLDSYFTDFYIQNDLIIRKNSITRIYEVEPFDIALLNEQDREHFFIKLKQAIHVLPAQTQFIVRKVQAKSDDYSKHFFSLYDDSTPDKEALVHEYIENLRDLIDSNSFFVTKHFAVISTSCTTNKPQAVVEGVKKLNDVGSRLSASLSVCNIATQPVVGDELKQFVGRILR